MKHEETHQRVRTAYTSALEHAESCSPGAVSSFGCGTPLAFAEVQPGDVVVDLGCGAGPDLLVAAERVGPTGRVIGVDMTDAMLESARRNLERAGARNVELRKGLIEELPVEDESVDHVISNCVINLSPEKPRVFAEIRRVLRPGGRFSISDIVVEELPDWIRDQPGAYESCIAGAISEADYLAGLAAAGLVAEVAARQVYGAAEISGMIQGNCLAGDLDPAIVQRAVQEVAGKVWSARFIGHRQEEAA